MSDLKAKILDASRSDLAAIESALAANLNPHLELVREVAGHILFSGGKRLRPLLMVLAARICGYTGDYDRIFSTAIEYLHAATLLHDDVVDGASRRRGKEAAHRKWGGPIAVLVGDFLLARALSISAGTGNVRIVRILAELTEQMSQGEVHQLMRIGDVALGETEYLEVIRRKTAVLFAAACRVSAVLAEAPAAQEGALARYGEQLGMAFQIADDLFDYTRRADELGKPVGSDLREGKLTLPLIHLLAVSSAAEREWIASLVRARSFTAEEFARLLGRLEAAGSLAYTRAAAAAFIEEAKAALACFPGSAAKATLIDIADYTLERRV